MKKFLVAVMLSVMAIAAHAEASFEQIEGLIQQQNYSAAAQGLEVIIQNHPKSAKAFYAMAQAQAGLGNLEKAKKALDIATGLNPTLDFAPASSVQSLRQAITPQTAKIEAVSESHALRNFVYFVLFAGFGVACYFMYSVYARKQEEEEMARKAAEADLKAERDREHEQARQAQVAREAEEEAAREALRQHKNYGHERFDPTNPDVLLPKKTKAQLKKEADEAARIEAEAEARRQRLRAEASEEDARRARSYSSTPTTTVVNNGSSSGDLAMGMMIGSMMSNNHSHDTTRIVERETVREVPAKSSRDSSWDDTPSRSSSSSRSSSWDDDSSSSSKSSSSWSGSSDSSSSWDSGSSSDSSSSSSSSSWD